MKLGIVGLPNVGKSTLFNAITSTKNAAAANYPFCTIDPNTGVVPVPDARLDKLAEIWDTNKKTPAIVEFVDIAGLVKTLVFPLIEFEEDLDIQASESEDGGIYIEIRVNEEDAGKVIGRQGRVIKAIRTLARAAASRTGTSVEVELID